MSFALVICSLEEAEAICRMEELTLQVETTSPPRAFAGGAPRVVRARQRGRVMEILVAAFGAAQDPLP